MRSSVLAACLSLVSISAAQVARYCPTDVSGICYSVNVPSKTASSGSGDIYFQIKGPSSNQWIGLGEANGDNGMVGANIFVIYADADGKNVTLSPRLGVAEVMPLHDTDAKVTLLDGSGIENGMMTANVRCSNCNSWSGGSLTYTSTSSSWIWAQKSGDSLASNDPSAQIVQHDDMGTFNLDLSTAKGGSSQNPFTASSSSGSPAGSPSGSPYAAPSSSASGSGGNVGSTGDDDDGASSMMTRVQIAHGTLMGLTMVILLPVGVLIRRLAPSTSIWVHAGMQMFSWCLAIAGMGLGIWLALHLEYLTQPHAIIGLVVVCGLVFQPILGLLQHSYFQKHGRRGIFGWVHAALGTALIILGTINGGLGLQLAEAVNPAIIAYSVVAGVLDFFYLGILVLTVGRKRGSGGVNGNGNGLKSG